MAIESSVATPQEMSRVTIRFAGDSGDGMQLTGGQFTHTSAIVGNDLATLPDFPAEIRAPAGTVAGVSGFQVQFGAVKTYTAGDRPDTLVAMNPAALKHNLADLEGGAHVIINTDAFTEKNLQRAGFEGSPLEDGTLDDFIVHEVALTKLTHGALTETDLSKKEKDRCKNFFALGLAYWMYGRPLEPTLEWIAEKFSKKERFANANVKTLKAGFHYGETTETFASTYRVAPSSSVTKGVYRHTTGNVATAWGFVAASELCGLELFLGSYPITPASDILHELSKHKNFGVRTFQAEDEIAAVAAAVGAAFGGSLALTTTSGPGLALKGEAIGLAIMTELPMVVVNVQRGGPSTGLPTKTEQSDLLQGLFGRNGEAPMPVLAPATPAECFDMAIEACRIALKYMTPVLLLSDGYVANGSEPWKIPNVDDLPRFPVAFHTEPEGFLPYSRDPDTLARPWVRPGTPGLEHRIGGLEKQDKTGNVSYDPNNHELMTRTRVAKVAGIAAEIPLADPHGPEGADTLLIGWGGTYGALRATVIESEKRGNLVHHLHLRHINPLPRNLDEVLGRYKRVVVAELNLGQLNMVLRAKYAVDTIPFNKVKGQPFKVSELLTFVHELLHPEARN